MSEEFNVGSWVSDGVKGAKNAVQGLGSGLLPEEFKMHLKASRKEFLLAFRSLVDKAIAKTDAPKKAASRRATKIKVE